MADSWSKSLFEPHLNTTFEITDEAMGTIKAELVEVIEKKADRVESLSVLFRGPKKPVLRHETHLVKHPKMGERKIFLGPIVYPKQDGIYYQAVFTRLKEKTS
jgi:hypothetical protein